MMKIAACGTMCCVLDGGRGIGLAAEAVSMRAFPDSMVMTSSCGDSTQVMCSIQQLGVGVIGG
jgi:hypothetical protein